MMTTLKLITPPPPPPKKDNQINFKIAVGYDAAAQKLNEMRWLATPLPSGILGRAFDHLTEVSRAHWDAHMTGQNGTVRTKAEQKAAFSKAG
jgi:hypothetical protein